MQLIPQNITIHSMTQNICLNMKTKEFYLVATIKTNMTAAICSSSHRILCNCKDVLKPKFGFFLYYS